MSVNVSDFVAKTSYHSSRCPANSFEVFQTAQQSPIEIHEIENSPRDVGDMSDALRCNMATKTAKVEF